MQSRSLALFLSLGGTVGPSGAEAERREGAGDRLRLRKPGLAVVAALMCNRHARAGKSLSFAARARGAPSDHLHSHFLLFDDCNAWAML